MKKGAENGESEVGRHCMTLRKWENILELGRGSIR